MYMHAGRYMRPFLNITSNINAAARSSEEVGGLNNFNIPMEFQGIWGIWGDSLTIFERFNVWNGRCTPFCGSFNWMEVWRFRFWKFGTPFGGKTLPLSSKSWSACCAALTSVSYTNFCCGPCTLPCHVWPELPVVSSQHFEAGKSPWRWLSPETEVM